MDWLKEKDSCGVGFVAHIGGKKDRKILELGINSVKNLIHRGAVSYDGKTGDGAGILTQIPEKIFIKELSKNGIHLESGEKVAVGVFFLPHNEKGKIIMEVAETSAKEMGVRPLMWREVPTDDSALGQAALKTKPNIKHLILGAKGKSFEIERKLFLLRKLIEKRASQLGAEVYIPSISSEKIVYKGLFTSSQIDKFYLDLQNPEYETSICVFHERYSTNTTSHWFIAQPFRFIAHNGEINSLLGNVNWMKAREYSLKPTSKWSADEIDIIKPIIWEDGSDSSMLDNAVEFYYFCGKELPVVISMLIPEPFESVHDMPEDVKALFEYHSYFMEPWDGPAAVVFSDGVGVGLHLDRNGLRPARYGITKDNLIIAGSEFGISQIPLNDFVVLNKVEPGKMIYVDTSEGKFYEDHQIKKAIAMKRNYSVWISRSKKMKTQLNNFKPVLREDEIVRIQNLFGYTEEDIERFIKEMAAKGSEAVYSMGDDTPISLLSSVPRNIFSYFKQRFAQVTNPPIDPYREDIVVSLTTIIGERGDGVEEDERYADVIELDSPIITGENLEAIKEILPYKVFDLSFDPHDPSSLERELRKLVEEVCKAAKDDKIKLVILSDRGVIYSEDRAVMPSLLAVGTVHKALVKNGLRLKVSIIVESGEPREEHHFACLIGYGADAIYPYLAFETAYNLKEEHRTKEIPHDRVKLIKNYKSALEKGIKKIMSKMGISVLSSYKGAQIFDIIGLSEEIVDLCFEGTPAWFTDSGVMFKDIASDYIEFWKLSRDSILKPYNFGFFKFIKDREYHLKNPYVFKPLHKFTETGEQIFYEEFTKAVDSRPPSKIRDIFDIKPVGPPVPLDEVEPVENILKRFYISSMSFGALSPEAHETLAIGANRIGVIMGSGEGGESPHRYDPYESGDWANSQMKQIASGRFGVTTEYAVNCIELEIKIAQGSKPGEGGQLPGSKVTQIIALTRRSVPGITLISPPPHHDIYSIEDLSQLIYDLKKVNTEARVSVKLVAESGVGVVASGVVKAYADIVHIAGDEGGTGASPPSSIKNAGIPWELGLIETQAVLIRNNLRDRVKIRVDGGLLNGTDVVKAAVLGAELFGFGSSAMIAIGCVMARQCHLNTCPVGIASQREDLRKKFPGSPERIQRYLTAVAQEVRQILASLGARSLSEIIGRIDLVIPKGIISKKTGRPVDANYLKRKFVDIALGNRNSKEYNNEDVELKKIIDNAPTKNEKDRNDRPETPDEDLNSKILEDVLSVWTLGEKVKLSYNIDNIHRSVGATLSGFIAKKWGDGLGIKKGLAPRTIEIEFKGIAGQSFGAFLVKGIKFVLKGVANDYVGKALSGGEIIIIPPHSNMLCAGNVCLYGGTGGYFFASGKVGERFAIRNSGVFAVAEGSGNHCMEYMTNGVCIILGEVGRNLGAGMTGGIGFVLNDTKLKYNINDNFVFLKEIDNEFEYEVAKKLLLMHYTETGSKKAEDVLEDGLKKLLVVVPKEFAGYKEKFLQQVLEKIDSWEKSIWEKSIQ